MQKFKTRGEKLKNQLIKIYLKPSNPFSDKIKFWVESKFQEVIYINEKSSDHLNEIDGLIIFNENQSMSKEISEMKMSVDKQSKPIHKIDINGTLMAGISNLSLWLERSSCNKVLIVGGDELVTNPNLDRYLLSL